MCSSDLRANKGYRPGREAWRACALVLVLVFWVLGCASPNPSSPELGPTVCALPRHLPRPPADWVHGVGCIQGAGEVVAAGTGAAVLRVFVGTLKHVRGPS